VKWRLLTEPHHQVPHTGIWKDAVAGRCQGRRLNLEGDVQAVLPGTAGRRRPGTSSSIDSGDAVRNLDRHRLAEAVQCSPYNRLKYAPN
jgi:hypothetical protein